jgi:hypothetical protein
VAGAILTVGSAQQNSAGQIGRFSELTLQLNTTKSEFVKLEPIPLTITLKNQTSKKIRGHAALRLGTKYVDLFVERYGEMRRVEHLTTQFHYPLVSSSDIKPKAEFRDSHLLNLDLANLFPEAGLYRLQVVLYDESLKETVKSNVLDISITNPVGQDLEAFYFLSNRVNASNFFEGVVHSSPARVREFVEKFGESSYGPYATFLLGQFHFLRGEHQVATVILDKLARRPDFIFSDKVADYLAKSRAKVAEQRDAKP